MYTVYCYVLKQTRQQTMFTVITYDYEQSEPATRHNVPAAQAHNIGLNGGFYKVQLINEFDQIDFEYK